MTADLPDALAALVRALEDRGFVVAVDSTYNDAFGNRLIEMRSRDRREGRAVRLVKDRGLWDVEVKIGREWHGVYSVMLALEAAPYGTRAQSHEERRTTTLRVVDGLGAGEMSGRALKRRLGEYRRAYWA